MTVSNDWLAERLVSEENTGGNCVPVYIEVGGKRAEVARVRVLDVGGNPAILITDQIERLEDIFG